ncbi:MAG: DNA polymerase III subunit delta [Candidatus Aminicenantes bacterium]|nr:DNA polymerase III subunit delta [Candidatus Aminicenantes bacterium]
MPEISFFGFLNKIQNKKENFPFNILFGFNEFLGENIINLFSDTFLQKKSDFNFRRYYFDMENEAGWEDIINEANSSSFFIQSRKIIAAVIREEKKIKLLKGDKEILTGYLKKPNPNTIVIIFISLNLIKDDYKQVKKQKIDKLLKELASPGTYHVNLDNIRETEVQDYVKNYLKKSGISITASALDRIIEIKGDDFVSILHQLPKLEIADLEEKRLDSQDIDAIITGVEAHSIWDLTDAIENEDPGTYLKVLRYLFLNGIKPTLIIGTLITHYNKIFTAKFLLKRRFPVNDIGKVLQQHPYFLNKFMNSVKNFSEKRLVEILKIIYKLDYEQKSSGEESARLSLQNFIFQIKALRSR